MFSRREFVQICALSTLPLVVGASLAKSGTDQQPSSLPRASLQRIVFDDRFDDSVAFAREASRLDFTTAAIGGDVTALWYDDLYHLWRNGPAAIAGMTTSDALFCLETMGNDAGLRLVMRADHLVCEAGVQHRLNGPRALLQHAVLEQSGARWSAYMAQLLARCPATRARQIQTVAYSRCASPRSAVGQPALVSWVLAPLSHHRSFFV